MLTTFRGVGTATGSVMLIVVGVAGYLLAPLNVARLLTLFVIYLGGRAVVAPAPGREPNVMLLMLGIWAAISAYGVLSFAHAWPLLVVLGGLGVIVQSLIGRDRVVAVGEP